MKKQKKKLKKLLSFPLITGIICAIIGIVLTITLNNFFILLIIAGIILAIPTKDCVKKFKSFLKSFKSNKLLLFTAVLDAIYWIIFFVLVIGAKKLLELKTNTLTLQASQASFEAMQQNLAAAKGVLIFMLILFIVLILLLLIIYTWTRYFIWLKLMKKKYSKKRLLKFFGLNFLWWLLWIPLSLILITGVKQAMINPITIALIIFYIYMTTKLHYTMLKSNSIKESFAQGIGNLVLIPRFLQTIANIVIVYFIISGIIALLMLVVPANYIFFVHAGLYILFIAWLRIYLKSFIEESKGNEIILI